jgi:D-alanyl-D-alanine carboxypeptidase
MASAAGPAGGIAADAPSIARWGYLLYGGHIIDSALVEQMTKADWGGSLEWYGLGTGGWVQGKDVFVGHSGDIATYHGDLVMSTAENVAIAVLVPAPARYRPEVDVETNEVPDLLLAGLRQG